MMDGLQHGKTEQQRQTSKSHGSTNTDSSSIERTMSDAYAQHLQQPAFPGQQINMNYNSVWPPQQPPLPPTTTSSTNQGQEPSTSYDTSNDELNCNHCNEIFMTHSELHIHYGLHRFCKLCKIQFGSAETFYNHILEFHVDMSKNPAICRMCNCNNITDIISHVRCHAFVKTESVSEISKFIASLQQLTPEALLRLSQIKPIIKTHHHNNIDPSRIIICDKCNDDITLIPHNRHICSTLTDCFQCNSKFNDKSDLINHIKNSHFKNNICDICKLNIDEIPDLAEHVKNCIIIPTFRVPKISKPKEYHMNCNQCGNRIRCSRFKQHFARDHKCMPCNLVFNNRNVLIDHLINQRHYSKFNGCCQFCARTFSGDESFYTHLKIHWSPFLTEKMPQNNPNSVQNNVDTSIQSSIDSSRHRQPIKKRKHKHRHSASGSHNQHSGFIECKPEAPNNYCLRCETSFLSKENHILHTKLFHFRNDKCTICTADKSEFVDITEHINSHAIYD